MDSRLTRRDVLKAGAAVGAAAIAADPLAQVAGAAARPLGHLSDIEHVIILTQENRSFDHYFGTYSGVEGFGNPAAKSIFEQGGYPVEGYEGKLLPFHLETGGTAQCMPDITHSWQPQHKAWDGGAMDKILQTHLEYDGPEAGPETMGYYEQADIPFYRALANSFTICDHYHCSVFGPTYPNRLYAVSGTIDPNGENGGPVIDTTIVTLSEGNTFAKWTTMAEQLQSKGITWKSYSGEQLGLEDNLLGFFEKVVKDPTLHNLAFNQTYPHDFKRDLGRGELPQVSWINTSAVETEHPGNSSAKTGEHVTAEIIKMVRKHKKVWEKTAIFITWDENGGFFDHVAPPVPPPGTANEFLTVPARTHDEGAITGPIGLGFRVPMLVVSPFTRGGLVSSEVYDHTSVLRFIETRWGVEVPNLSEWRRATTGDLTGAFNFAAPPVPGNPKLPEVTLAPGEEKCSGGPPVTVPPNSYPVQEPGTRKSPSGIV
jgi:phospholipase C